MHASELAPVGHQTNNGTIHLEHTGIQNMIYIFFAMAGYAMFHFCLVNPNKGLESLCPANRLTNQSGLSLCVLIGLVFAICIIKMLIGSADFSRVDGGLGENQELDCPHEIIDDVSALRQLKTALPWNANSGS